VNEIVQKSMELGFISREKENIILISTACDLKQGEGSENKDVQNKIGQLFDDVNKAVSDLKKQRYYNQDFKSHFGGKRIIQRRKYFNGQICRVFKSQRAECEFDY